MATIHAKTPCFSIGFSGATGARYVGKHDAYQEKGTREREREREKRWSVIKHERR